MVKPKLSIFAAPLLWACCSLAAEPDPGSLRACAAEKDDGLRLACYDREVRDVMPLPSVVAPADRPAEPPRVEDKFGARGGELARKQAREDEKVQLKEVSARVTSLEQRPRGERVFTLDNGQVWVEKRRANYMPVEVGETVTITSGALGAYRLSEDTGRSTQVQRVQ
jgi:hypothetical protein